MVNKTVKRIAITVIVLALLGAAGLGVWASTPLDEILSPTPTPAPTAVPVKVAVKSVGGYSACVFTVNPVGDGWRLDYSFTTPGTTGTLSEGDTILDTVTVTPQQFPVRRPPITLEANTARKFRIEVVGPGSWQYAIRPAEGTSVDESFESQPPDGSASGAQQAFRIRNCRG